MKKKLTGLWIRVCKCRSFRLGSWRVPYESVLGNTTKNRERDREKEGERAREEGILLLCTTVNSMFSPPSQTYQCLSLWECNHHFSTLHRHLLANSPSRFDLAGICCCVSFIRLRKFFPTCDQGRNLCYITLPPPQKPSTPAFAVHQWSADVFFVLLYLRLSPTPQPNRHFFLMTFVFFKKSSKTIVHSIKGEEKKKLQIHTSTYTYNN